MLLCRWRRNFQGGAIQLVCLIELMNRLWHRSIDGKECEWLVATFCLSIECFQDQLCDTVPEKTTNISPENMPKPNRKVVFRPSIFRGQHVSIRKCILGGSGSPLASKLIGWKCHFVPTKCVEHLHTFMGGPHFPSSNLFGTPRGYHIYNYYSDYHYYYCYSTIIVLSCFIIILISITYYRLRII